MYSQLVLASFLALGCAVLCAPVASLLAKKWGIVDAPNRERKFHQGSMPLAGGGVTFVSLCVAGLWLIRCDGTTVRELVPLYLAMLTLTCVGVVDDRCELNSRRKLAGQCLAVAILFFGGFKFHGLTLLGMPLDLGLLQAPVTAVLLLAAINAINFLDGADGFVASIGIVTSAALCGLAVVSGQFVEAFLAASLAGALLGFLAFNFPPARMFLGDSGSMLVGLLLGCLIFRVGGPAGGGTPIGAALALLALPFMDISAAIVRRKLTGRSMAAADRGHLHHCLLRRGMGPKQVVAAAACFCSIPAVGAFVALATGFHAASWGGVILLGIVLVVTRSFGANELILARGFCRKQTRATTQGTPRTGRQIRIGLEHTKESQEIWSDFSEFGASHDLSRVTMHLNGSWMDDGLDVFWESTMAGRRSDNWRARLPIFSRGHLFGHVEIAGNLSNNCGKTILAPLEDLIESKLPSIDRLLHDAQDDSDSTVGKSTGEGERWTDPPSSTKSRSIESKHPIAPICLNGIPQYGEAAESV